MTGIALYAEGGGDTAAQQAELRVGLDQLFTGVKQAARLKRLRWKLVMCGSRSQARDDFLNALKRGDPETLCVLLVDSEEGLPTEQPIPPGETSDQAHARRLADATVRRDHLIRRDGWHLEHVAPELVHLMVACMETWIVADPEGMARAYGKNFHADRLPDRPNLEVEAKASLFDKLAKATQETARGAYSADNRSKIRHARKLLENVRAERVAARCPRFATLIEWLTRKIDEA